ncbi:MAG: CarD family transcriptional regulator [Myxococcales bacterium]|nr:CarD family transcriptional regulator [Myxococcales bacterium]
MRTRRWDARIGQLAVYPGRGVARVSGVEKRTIADFTVELLVLTLLEDNSRILIPCENVEAAGLREVVGRREVGRIWEILRAARRPRPRGQTWSRQFRDNQEKLRHGSVFEVAEILRDLLRLQLEKELSFGEHRLLDLARSLVVHELAAALRKPAAEVEAEIKAEIKQSIR